MLSKLHSLNLKLWSKQYNKKFVLHLIVAPHLSSVRWHNCSTKTRQAGRANEQSMYYLMSMVSGNSEKESKVRVNEEVVETISAAMTYSALVNCFCFVSSVWPSKKCSKANRKYPRSVLGWVFNINMGNWLYCKLSAWHPHTRSKHLKFSHVKKF